MGEVWRATDTVLGRPVAVKVLLASLVDDPSFNRRFRTEARIMAALRHPNVVDVYDYGESDTPDGGTATYLVMAYIDGEPLSKRIATHGRLSVNETLRTVAQAADALHAAHTSGIVHRDVKPGNLLVEPDGTVMLADFGVARSTGGEELTKSENVPGTALYMAPEQVSGHPVSAATDIYALGVVAYQCLVGEPPFTGEAPVEVALHHLYDEPPPLPDTVPARVRNLVLRALTKEPAGRYPDAEAFAGEARAALADQVDTAADPDAPTVVVRGAVPGPPTPAEPDPVPVYVSGTTPRRSRRHRAAAAGAGVLLLVLVGLAAIVGFSRYGAGQPPADRPPSRVPAASTSQGQPAATPSPTGTVPPASAAPVATGGPGGPGGPGGTGGTGPPGPGLPLPSLPIPTVTLTLP
jgi:serine/threonine-protein kinase